MKNNYYICATVILLFMLTNVYRIGHDIYKYWKNDNINLKKKLRTILEI